MNYYNKNSGSTLLSITSNDVTLVESFLMTIMVQLLAQPLTVVVIVGTMFVLNWELSMYFLILGPAIAVLLGMIGSAIQRIGSTMQENIAKLTKTISETISHIQIIKAFNSENLEIKEFNHKNDHQLALADQEIKIRLLALPMSDFLGITAIILILALGAVGIRMGIATAGEVTKFATMAIILSEPISSFNQMILVVRKLGPSTDRIFGIIDTPEEKDNHTKFFGDMKGEVQFKDLSFAHDEQTVLSDINLTIKSKQTIALIGPSGSGKSSLASLIPKFYLPSEGAVLIDGKDISEYNSASVREHLSIVTQDTSLFSDTIYNNIIMSKPDATMEEVIAAAKTAHADEFIMQHPDGYDRFVGDQGGNLSGGERQRIILARAMLRKPAVLILDEATSALDSDSEQKITEALEHIYGQQTTIIIAHKLSTIEKADIIVVLKYGKIIETGAPLELLKKEESYYSKSYRNIQ